MWNKEIVISNHVKERFRKRNINLEKDNKSIVIQILRDLKPLNVSRISNLNNGCYRIDTRYGKTYILKNIEDNKIIVQTVYKTRNKFKPLSGFVELNYRNKRAIKIKC